MTNDLKVALTILLIIIVPQRAGKHLGASKGAAA